MPRVNGGMHLGSRSVWLWLRMAEGLTLALLTWHYVGAGIRNMTAFDFVVLFIVIAVVIRFHPVAYAYGDERGLTCRRYFRKQFRTWDVVSNVEWSRWNTSGVVIRFASAPWYSRTIELYENPTVREAFSQATGKRVPLAVEWMRSHIHKLAE